MSLKIKTSKNYNLNLIFLLIFTTILFTSFYSSVIADEGDDDGIDDKYEDETQRSIQIHVESDQVEIESRLDNGNTQDDITFHIKQESEGISIELGFSSNIKTDDGDEGTEQEISFEVEFKELIEFIDSNGDGVFNTGDTQVSNYLISNFNDIQHSVEEISTDTKLYYFLLSTSDDVFKLHVYMAEEYTIVNGDALITPVELKIDIEITNYNFIQGDTKLALYTQLSAEQEYEHDYETEDEKNGYSESESEVQIQTANTAAFFSWSEKALVDDVETTVRTTPLSQDDLVEEDQKIYLIYEQGTRIYHDPKIGIEGLLENSIPNSSIILIVVTIVGIVGIVGTIASKEEYRQFLLNRIGIVHTGPHNLTMQDVLDNKIRSRILDLVIDDPGIHYSDLFNKSDTSASNFAWHLDILETYRIIKKQRFGRYLIFFPYYDKNPFEDMDPKIMKSKTTLNILDVIGETPGIQQGKIAIRVGLNRKTVKYHLDKLVEAKLIKITKDGRKNIIHLIDITDIDERKPIFESEENL